MDTLSDNRKLNLHLTGTTVIECIITGGIPLLFYIVAIHHYGPGVTFDSINYCSGAMTISEGMKKVDGTSFYEWPPLYPIILSISNFINVNIISFTSILHGAILCINSCLIYLIAKKNITDKVLLYFTALAIAFSLPLLQIHIMVWSEPLFILFVLANFLCIEKYFHKPNWVNLILLIVCGYLMFLQRKSGYIFIAATIPLIFYSSKQKLIHSFVYTLFCCLPVVWWYHKKIELSGKFFGDSGFKSDKLLTNFSEFINTISSYFIPSNLNLIIQSIFLIAIIVLIISEIKKNKSISPIVFLSGWFTLLYYFVILFGLLFVHLSEPIDDRILIPVYPFVIILFTFICNEILNRMISNYKKALYFFLFLWLSYPIVRTSYHLMRWNKDGTGGYNSKSWNENSLFQESSKINSTTIITNELESVYYHIKLKQNKKAEIKPTTEKVKEGLYLCFKNNLSYSKAEFNCDVEKYKHKKLIKETEEGTIWEVKN